MSYPGKARLAGSPAGQPAGRPTSRPSSYPRGNTPRYSPSRGPVRLPVKNPPVNPVIRPGGSPFGRVPARLPVSPYLKWGAKGAGMLFRIAKPWPLTLAMLALDLFPWGKDQDPGEHPYVNLGSYTLRQLCAENGLPPTGNNFWSDNGTNEDNCLVGQAASEINFAPNNPPYWLTWMRQYWLLVGLLARSQSIAIYELNDENIPPSSRVLPSPGKAPSAPKYIPPVPWWPSVDPMSTPIFQPMPTPQPLPYPLVPHRPNSPFPEAPKRGNGPKTRPRPRPSVRPRPRPLPYETPAVILTPKPGVKTFPRPGVHRRLPPRHRVRERKFMMGGQAMRMLFIAFNLMTEFLDFAQIAWESIDPAYRSQRWPGLMAALGQTAMNIDKIRPGSFLALFIANELEDKAFGRLSGLAAKSAKAAYQSGYAVRENPNDLGGWDEPERPVLRDEYLQAFNRWLEEHLN